MAMKSKKMKTGAQMVVDILIDEGVTMAWGVTGGAILPVYDAMFLNRDKIKLIDTRHEQGAVHMAEGYAKSTGKVGVCVVTSGPGATNIVTGLADAYMDSVPLVAITGQVPTSLIGTDGFQEADVVGITRSCTKHNYLVKNIQELPQIVRDAFFIARTGRPGPVLIDIPKDIAAASAEVEIPDEPSIPLSKFVPTPEKGQVDKIAELLKQAKRPLIYAGGGVINAGASEELYKFARKTNIPVTLTLMGLGAYPATDRQFIDMLGMHGSYRANMALTHCDLLIAIGSRFDDRVTGKLSEFSPHSKKVHIDVDPTSIGKNVKVDAHVLGDMRSILKDLTKKAGTKEYDEWYHQLESWNHKHPLAYKQDPKGPTLPQFAIDEIYRITKGDAYVATEVGQHQMWAAQYYKFNKPRRWLTSGGLGTMGFGFPAAIGAAFAHPGATVVDIAGDGSFQMTLQELAIVKEYELNVKTIVINNKFMGMVKQWQDLFFDKRYAATSIPAQPDFVKLADAYGIAGYRAETPGETTKVLEKALLTKGPCLVDVVVDAEEHVYPMVPAGGAVKDIVLSKAHQIEKMMAAKADKGPKKPTQVHL
ncbi:MAG TPA: biosynthetic-type acetolactate synthase large subunit [bacterium]|nr:biosynthetic-type acetolactate synthase large subunit [bacterium]